MPPSFFKDLARISARHGWELDALAAHISHESRFRADAKNPLSSSRGLIQMLDSSARRYAGVSASQLAKMSATEQLPGIERYFDIGKPLAGADFLILGVSRNPSLIGAADSRVIFRAGSSAAKVNPSLTDRAGNITVGSLRRHFARWTMRQEVGGPVDISTDQPSQAGAGSAILFAILGAVALAKFGKVRKWV